MSTLHLHVKRVYFDSIRIGTKGEEYRLCTPHWQKRIVGRHYDCVIIYDGYPGVHEFDRMMRFAWNGYRKMTLTHPHFGPGEVDVYAIDLSERIDI